MPSVELHSIHEVPAPAPCFIVDMTIHESESELKFSQVVFHIEVGGRKAKQVPFAEHFLSQDGENILGDYKYAWHNPKAWIGEVRLAFLMHYLKPGQFIDTPFGQLAIPTPTPLPDRLKLIKYVSPY